VTRSRWKARYLEARVRYLEGKVAAPPPAPAPVQAAPTPTQRVVEKPAPVTAATTPVRMERPAALSAPRGGAADDLRLISGISAQNLSALNALGVFHFDQLAAWRPPQAAWVDQYLNLRGRIAAERWVEQAAALARGERALENQAG
jgi:NADH-quinone oxidoreductase subunit E